MSGGKEGEINMKQFEITENHIKLLRHMNVSWWGCEFGAPSIDCKRPYGNSDVVSDICEILGWDFDANDAKYNQVHEAALAIHKEMDLVLQIVLVNLRLALAGEYQQTKPYDYRSWQQINKSKN